jgi:outer membrane protein OmpA-like peptidoglycan-associated protein
MDGRLRQGVHAVRRPAHGPRGEARGAVTTTERLLALQRSAGNAAVSSHLARVQRTCACAGHTTACTSCAASREEDPTVQRYAECTPATLSMQECPPRDGAERARARAGPMVFLPSLRLPAVNETGVLIANFDIGSSTVKPNLHQTLYWQAFLRQAASGRSKWRIEGFTDCQGKLARNQALRAARAKAVFDAMPAAVQRYITDVDPAAAGDCLTSNLSAADRTVNRSVAIVLVHSTVDMAPTTVKEKLERKTPKTDGCTQDQRDRLAIAFPLARRIGQQAMSAISWMKRGTPEEALLKKFFGPRAFDRRWRIKQNYAQALGALRTSPTYKCVAQGTDPCGSTTVAYVGLHAIVFGNPTVVCSSAFDVDHIELADTILHEATHLGAWTNDLEYCSRSSGCDLPTTAEVLPGIGLSDRGALNNADSYGRFASELFRS